MQPKNKVLLLIDGIINIILGLALPLSLLGIMELLQLPKTDTYFYPSVLGAVLLGIGLTLILEVSSCQTRGLGLGGAIVINLIGSAALIL